MEENKTLPQFSDTKDSIVDEKYLPIIYDGNLQLKNTLPELNFGMLSLMKILKESLIFQNESLKLDKSHYGKVNKFNDNIEKDMVKIKSEQTLKGRIDESRENFPEGEGELNLFKDFGKFLKKEFEESFDDFFTLGGPGGFNFGKYIKKGFGSLLGMTKPSEEKNKEKLFSQKNKIEDEIENLRKKESESSGSKKIEIGEKRRKLENELLEGPLKELQIIKQKEVNEEINSLEQLKVRRIREGASSKEVEDIEKEILETKQEFFELSEHMVSEYGKSFEKMDPLKSSKVSEESKSSPSDFSFRPISPENMEVIDFDPTFGKVLGSIDLTLKSIKDIQENIEDGTEDLNKAIVQKPDNSADISRQNLNAETKDDGVQKSTNSFNEFLEKMTDMFGKKRVEGALGGIGGFLGLLLSPIFFVKGFFRGFGESLKMLGLESVKQSFITKAGKFFTNIKNFFVEGLDKIGLGGVTEKIGGFFTGIKNFFSKGLDKIGLGGITEKIGGFFKNFAGSFDDILGNNVLKTFLEPFISNFSRIIGFADDLGALVGKAALPLQIIFGIINGVSGFMKGFSEGGILEGIKEAIVGVVDGIVGFFFDIPKALLSWILNMFGFEAISKKLDSFGFADVLRTILDPIFDMLGYIVSFLSFIFTPVFNTLGILFSSLMSVGTAVVKFILMPFTTILNFIEGAIKGYEEGGILGAISGGFSMAFEGIMNVFKSVFGAILDVIMIPFKMIASSPIFGMISKVLGVLWDVITSPFRMIYEFITSMFSSDGEKTAGFISSLLSGIWDVITSPFKMIWKAIKFIFKMSPVALITKMLKNVFKFVGNVFSALGDAISSLINWVTDKIKKLNPFRSESSEERLERENKEIEEKEKYLKQNREKLTDDEIKFLESEIQQLKKDKNATENVVSGEQKSNVERGLVYDSIDESKIGSLSTQEIIDMRKRGKGFFKDKYDDASEEIMDKEVERRLKPAIDSGLLDVGLFGGISIDNSMLKKSPTKLLEDILVAKSEKLSEKDKKLIVKEIESRKSKNQQLRSSIVEETQTNTVEQSLVRTTPEQTISKKDSLSSSNVSNNLNSFGMSEITPKTHHIGYVPEGSSTPMNIPKITGDPDKDYDIVMKKSKNMMYGESISNKLVEMEPKDSNLLTEKLTESQSKSIEKKSFQMEMVKPSVQLQPSNPVNNVVNAPMVSNVNNSRRSVATVVNQSPDSIAESFRKNY